MCSACCGLLCLLTLGCHSASWRRIHRPHRSCCTPPTWTRAPSLRPHSEARYRTPRTPPGSTTGPREEQRHRQKDTLVMMQQNRDEDATHGAKKKKTKSKNARLPAPGIVKIFSSISDVYFCESSQNAVVWKQSVKSCFPRHNHKKSICCLRLAFPARCARRRKSVNVSVITIRVDLQVDNVSRDVCSPP